MKISITGKKGTAENFAKCLEQFLQTEPFLKSSGGGTGDNEKWIVRFNVRDSKVNEFLKKIGK